MKGVSIVICCYNSAKLLPETLKHISKLKNISNFPWEVIVVNNASDDNTSSIAKKLFHLYELPMPCKILYQNIQGLSYARKMGFDNSKYDYIIFCDDDNWLSEDYMERSFHLMETHPQIGALGGESEGVFEELQPGWFQTFAQNYSVGKQSDHAGDITWEQGVLWGAGMVVRKSALQELFSKGFRPLLSDRKGEQLASGGDSELCYALRLAGWKIWYDPSLNLKHFIPSKRLNWNYLRKLSRGFGAQKINFDAYLKAFEPEPQNFKQNLDRQWLYLAAKHIRKIRSYGFKKLLRLNLLSEGDPEILRMEKSIGRLKELLKIRGQYNKRIKIIKNASWRKIFSLSNI